MTTPGTAQAAEAAEARVEAVLSSTRPMLDEAQRKIDALTAGVLADVEADPDWDEDTKVQAVRECARRAGIAPAPITTKPKL